MYPLAIIPCSKEKIWDAQPDLGAVAAKHAYCSPLYELSKQYAEQHAERYVILSAKYGFLNPEDLIPGTYDVTFSRPNDPVVSVSEMTQQATAFRVTELLLLLPEDYDERVVSSVAGRQIAIHAPLRGMNDLSRMRDWLERELSA